MCIRDRDTSDHHALKIKLCHLMELSAKYVDIQTQIESDDADFASASDKEMCIRDSLLCLLSASSEIHKNNRFIITSNTLYNCYSVSLYYISFIYFVIEVSSM